MKIKAHTNNGSPRVNPMDDFVHFPMDEFIE